MPGPRTPNLVWAGARLLRLWPSDVVEPGLQGVRSLSFTSPPATPMMNLRILGE